MGKYDKKLTAHTLHLIEEDDFKTAYYILSRHFDEINLNAKTNSGDFMTTLLSYAACEHGVELTKRLFALRCLHLVLDRNLFVVNQIAGDGGGVLHCALAAASSSWEELHKECDGPEAENNYNEDIIKEDDDDESSKEDSEYSDSDEDSLIDHRFIQELKVEAQCVEHMIDLFNDMSSPEITASTIYLLCNKKADLSLPLIHKQCDYDSDTEDENELIFSRQAVEENWTPLMFALEWCIHSCIKCTPNKTSGNVSVALPTFVLIILLIEGSDPTYIGSSINSWQARDVLTSTSCFLTQMSVQTHQLKEDIILLYNRITDIFGIEMEDQPQLVFPSFDRNEDSYYNFLTSVLSLDAPNTSNLKTLTPIQGFVSNILSRNSMNAQDILKTQATVDCIPEKELLQEWCGTSYGDIFPILHSIWPVSDHVQSKKLLEMTAYLLLMEEFRFLLTTYVHDVSDDIARRCVISIFQNIESRLYHSSTAASLITRQESLLQYVLGKNSKIPLQQRQRILDRLLVESCSGKMWAVYSPHSTLLLLKCGSDPNIKSISHQINDGLTPLHFIAGNCRDSEGTEKVSCLLSDIHIQHPHERADLYARTRSNQQLAIEIALEKQNFLIVGKMLEVLGNEFIKKHIQRLDYATMIGRTAIHNASLTMFQYALYAIGNCCSRHDNLDSRELEKTIGQLLVSALDERSGFSKSSLNDLIPLIASVQQVCSKYNLRCLSSWTQDDVSGHNPLHLILRSDRTADLRNKLLGPLCELLHDDADASINQTCSRSFGGYTPLHLAYSLNCTQSITILLQYGADENITDAQGKKPSAMLSRD